MNTVEKSRVFAVLTPALAASKVRRCEARETASETAIHGAADAAELDVCRAHVTALEQRRSASVLACKPDEVLRTDSALLTARVAVEIAAAKASASAARHAAAVAVLRDADGEVSKAARAVIEGEMIELAIEVNAAFDHAMALGARLQAIAQRDPFRTPLHMLGQTLPAEVERALEKIPHPDLLRVPVHVLRAGGVVSSDDYESRLAVLMADNSGDPIDVDAAA
jgi:hypothetical protein